MRALERVHRGVLHRGVLGRALERVHRVSGRARERVSCIHIYAHYLCTSNNLSCSSWFHSMATFAFMPLLVFFPRIPGLSTAVFIQVLFDEERWFEIKTWKEKERDLEVAWQNASGLEENGSFGSRIPAWMSTLQKAMAKNKEVVWNKAKVLVEKAKEKEKEKEKAKKKEKEKERKKEKQRKRKRKGTRTRKGKA